MVPNGFNTEITATITLDGMAASVWKSFTYDLPSISAVVPGNLPTLGQSKSINTTSWFFAIGQNFGARESSPSTRVQGTTCESTLWVSWSSIASKLSGGVASYSFGHVPRLSVTCAFRISTVSSFFTY
eukprot:17875_5